MINFIKIILLKIFGLFPDSPFAQQVADLDVSYLQYLNWFFPLDLCLNLTLIWVNCMLLILVIKLLIKLLWDKLIGKLMSFVSLLGG